jgi:hypothetical protein
MLMQMQCNYGAKHLRCYSKCPLNRGISLMKCFKLTIFGLEGADHIIRSIATSKGSTCNSTSSTRSRRHSRYKKCCNVLFWKHSKNRMEVIHFEPMKQLMEVTYKFGFSTLQHMIQVLATDGYYQFNMVNYSLRKWHILPHFITCPHAVV